jgi:hypothetical protein
MKLDNSFRVGEVPVEVLDARQKTRFHTADGEAFVNVPHIVLRVTLADGNAWAVDPAGAQRGQYKAVLRFSDYNRDYVAQFPYPRMPYGSNASVVEATRKHCPHLMEIENYQIDELHEWAFKNIAVKNLLKVKPTEYETLKKSLVAHLATAAREYIKLARGDPTSKLRFWKASSTTFGTLSKEQKEKVERKKARVMADVDPDNVAQSLIEMGASNFAI